MFAFILFHKNFLCLLQLKEIFSSLSQTIIISMHQTSLDNTSASQESISYSSISKVLKIITHRPTG